MRLARVLRCNAIWPAVCAGFEAAPVPPPLSALGRFTVQAARQAVWPTGFTGRFSPASSPARRPAADAAAQAGRAQEAATLRQPPRMTSQPAIETGSQPAVEHSSKPAQLGAHASASSPSCVRPGSLQLSGAPGATPLGRSAKTELRDH